MWTNFLEKNGREKKKKHRIFPLYQLGAIQYYKCASWEKKKCTQKIVCNVAATAWTGVLSSQINFSQASKSRSNRAVLKCPIENAFFLM